MTYSKWYSSGLSIICCMSKVFERILHSKLKALSESASGLWFNDSQHDFLVGWSIESARSTLESIIEDNKKKLFDFCAFLDIKGAFDAAWQPAILHGLQCKGCPLYLVKILISFLNSPQGRVFLQRFYSCNRNRSWLPTRQRTFSFSLEHRTAFLMPPSNFWIKLSLMWATWLSAPDTQASMLLV